MPIFVLIGQGVLALTWVKFGLFYWLALSPLQHSCTVSDVKWANRV